MGNAADFSRSPMDVMTLSQARHFLRVSALPHPHTGLDPFLHFQFDPFFSYPIFLRPFDS
jgi:hypothetical protein